MCIRDRPTRLLDVSRDPMVALFFACSKYENTDGYVWLYPAPVDIHSAKLSDDYREIFDIGTGGGGQQGIDFYKAGRINEYVARIERPPLDQQFLINAEFPNMRILAQRGAFMWSPKPLQPLTKNSFSGTPRHTMLD